MKFTRVQKQNPMRDEIGKVRIVIYLVTRAKGDRRAGHTNVKGNISKSFTVQNAKLSDVAKVIEDTLFKESE